MSEHPYSRESVGRILEQEDLTTCCSPRGQSDLEARRYCAYNQTRERFICVDVEAADFSAASLNSRLPGLTPNGCTALWILPFRGISPSSIRIPVDLLYLDPNFVVLDAVESFPISRPSPSSAPAASVLALPAHTIGSTQTQRGDRLILCTPEQLKRHLLETSGTKVDAQAEKSPLSDPSAASHENQPTHKASGKVPLWADKSHPKHSNEYLPTEANRIAVSSPSEPDPVQSSQKKAADSKNWLQRLLSPEPPDPRKAARESLSWLAAYFFTGGTPMAHGIRDISSTGLYVYTEERWYLGTVIRITLTDQRHPTAEGSCTVNAKVVRWGNDGVGCEFVLKNKKGVRHGKGSAASSIGEEISSVQMEQFLELVRDGASKSKLP